MILLRLFAVLFALALLACPAAYAQTQQEGVFGINPSVVELDGRPPRALNRLELSNTTPTALEVEIRPRLMQENLDGSYLPLDTPPSAFQGPHILSVTPSKFTMPTGSTRSVEIRWEALQPGRKGAYIALEVIAEPPTAPGQNVLNRYQLIELNFLRLDGVKSTDAEIRGIRGEQGENQTLRFFARVHNGGRVHDRPFHGSTKIYDLEDNLRAQVKWDPGIVIPKADREFEVVIDELLPPGTYRAVSTMRWGGPTGELERAELEFTLVGPNQLPTTKMELQGIQASGTIGGSASVGVDLINRGTSPAKPTVDVELFEVADDGTAAETPVAKKTLTGEEVSVAKQGHVDVELGSNLKLLRYRAVVTLRVGDQEFGKREQDFQPGRPQENGFWDSIKGVLPWVVGLIALAALLLLLLRRRGRRTATGSNASPVNAVTEPPPGRAPAPAAPRPAPAAASDATDGAILVNLNTAGLDQLQTLPGIGRKAAERIVEHRDEYGAFGSVEDLVRVSGFGPARIADLRGRVTV